MIIVRAAFCTASVTSPQISLAVKAPRCSGDSRDVLEGHAEYRGDILMCLGELREELQLLLGVDCEERRAVRIMAARANSVEELSVGRGG